MKRRLEIARGLLPHRACLPRRANHRPRSRRAAQSGLRALKQHEEITIFMTTHYMEAGTAIGSPSWTPAGIVALGSPETLKAEVGWDRVQSALRTTQRP
jgi:ABC-2 type transport system ATP-binding protein